MQNLQWEFDQIERAFRSGEPIPDSILDEIGMDGDLREMVDGADIVIVKLPTLSDEYHYLEDLIEWDTMS